MALLSLTSTTHPYLLGGRRAALDTTGGQRRKCAQKNVPQILHGWRSLTHAACSTAIRALRAPVGALGHGRRDRAGRAREHGRRRVATRAQLPRGFVRNT